VPTERDYYSILQVNRNASEEEIERAWERLSKTYDPATSRKPRAAQRHAEIQEAYEALGDPQKRREYDRVLRRGDREAAGVPMPADVLSNRFVWVAAGTLIASIIAIIAVILVFGGGGDEEPVVLATNTPGPTPTPAPTAPSQTPGVPEDSPPEIEGEEVVLESGLTYIDFVVGTGEEAKTGDFVAVNYTGWLESGGDTFFDSSLDDPAPFTVTLGAGGVIQGWELGLPGMKEGGKRRLIIPPALGYGATGQGSIPPNATLIFDVELVDILTPAPVTPTPLPGDDVPAPTQDPTDPPASPPEVTDEGITTESGLIIIDIEEGTGDPIQEGDIVAINYTGWLADTGDLFDSSLDNTSPYRLQVGAGGVIDGWEEGVPGMKPGGKRRLIIPPELAYGDAGQGDIPPGATLIFDLEYVALLVDADGTPAATPTP
jgi:FKBP-type peptidyl-prolyl cis-trans isomerase